ncbi:dTDP-4-dehydrorhamnose reductase [Aliikangiella maris]|uniref:dTDP-4-dehydrorhamnose reductase n=2 Tax=Aliikangiella maris TaxID=3162458 RepID=A0ABV2BNS1_9GAMM
MRILLTGCNGQVGFLLKKKLEGKCELLALTRESLDITDEPKINLTVAEFKPQVIINAAAYTAVDKAESEKELAFEINATGPKLLAKAASSVNASIIHISTDYVFEGNKSGTYSETDHVNPQGVYGESKLAGEIAVRENCEKHIILRTAWVFGEHGNNFVKTMLRLGQERESLGIVGDQFGGPTYAGDIADAIVEIIYQIEDKRFDSWGSYHYSGYPYASWYEFAEQIFVKAKGKGLLESIPKLNKIQTEDYPTPAARPKNSKLECSKVKLQLGIEPSDWLKALEKICEYE